TFEKYRHHISPITGIVRGVYPSPWHGVAPLRTYVAGHNFALINDSLYFLKDGLRSHSSGKGRTDAQARTSALCEALERYSGVYRGEETRITGSYRELADSAINARMKGPTQDIVLGFGAHMDVQIGVMRAVTEMNQ